MNAIRRPPRRAEVSALVTSAAQCIALAILPGAALLFVGGAQAQSAGCSQFKDTLAARVDPSIRGFTLDLVPGHAPVPPGAKVFGTCDGGAYKILFRRGGNTRPTPGALSGPPPAGVGAPASAPQAVAAPKPAPAPMPSPPAPAPVAAFTAPPPVAQAVARANDPVAAPAQAPEKPQPAGVKEPEPARSLAQVEAAPAPAPPGEAGAADSGPQPGASGVTALGWRWMWALLGLPLAAWLWARAAHRRAYDEAGLPRGPRL